MPPSLEKRKTQDVPQRLLDLLTDQPQTGDALGLQLGVNRVTVNTLARKLQEDGAPLAISRAGYALLPDTPAPALVRRSGPLGLSLRYRASVNSTQDELRTWADDPHDPAPHGAVVVAERQLTGRGRRGRVWETTPGTMVFSVLLRAEGMDLSLPVLPWLPLAVGVAVQAACQVGGLKWPNDLLAPDGRKLAGILMEADLRGEEARRAIIGIGLNVSAAPPGAASLHEFRPGITRAALLGDLLEQLNRWLITPSAEVRRAWQAVNVTLNRPVRIPTPTGPVEGLASDLDASGSLIVATLQGLHTVSAGDVQLIGELRPQ